MYQSRRITMACDIGGVLPSGWPHLYWRGLATLWIFSAAVSAMQMPDKCSSPAYQWVYRFTHLLAANLDRAGLLGEAQQLSGGDVVSSRVMIETKPEE
jgi:hypothetical protein